MDERIRKRRRSVSWERSRGRRTALFLAALVLCSLIAFLWLRSTDAFAVTRISASGTEQITREQLADLTSSAMGQSLLSLSTKKIEEAFLQLPYVESVDISRAFPNTLEIDVVEYRPVARVRDQQGQTWLVSDSGVALEDKDPQWLPGLPLVLSDASFTAIAGESLPAGIVGVLPLAERLQDGGVAAGLPDVAWVKVSLAGCASLMLADGGELRLGTPEGLDQKLQVAVDVVQKCMEQGRVIEYVDASVINRVAVKAK